MKDIMILREYINEKIGVVYQWEGIGRSETFNGLEIKNGILREVNDKEIYLELIIKPIIDPFGEISGHRIPFKKTDIGELHKISNKKGENIYDYNSVNYSERHK